MEAWLRWAGVADVETIALRPDAASGDVAAGRATAQEEARAVAAGF